MTKEEREEVQEILVNSIEGGDIDGVMEAINAGADVNMVDKYYRSPAFFLAFSMRDVPDSIRKACLDAGADLSLVDKDGNNALYDAIDNVNVEGIRLLIEAGIDVNAKFNKGRETALSFVLENSDFDDDEREEVVKMLMSAGADYSESMKTAFSLDKESLSDLLDFYQAGYTEADNLVETRSNGDDYIPARAIRGAIKELVQAMKRIGKGGSDLDEAYILFAYSDIEMNPDSKVIDAVKGLTEQIAEDNGIDLNRSGARKTAMEEVERSFREVLADDYQDIADEVGEGMKSAKEDMG